MSKRQKTVRRDELPDRRAAPEDELERGSPPAREPPAPPPEPPAPSEAGTSEALEELAGLDAGAFDALMQQATAQAGDHEPGDEVTGTIVRIAGDNAFVDLGGKAEAWISASELEEGEAAVGAVITARVLKERDDVLVLSRHLRLGGDMDTVRAAQESGIPVEGRVESRNSGGYIVALSGIRGFCPISQIDRFPGRELDRFIGQTYSFKIQEVREREVVLSRRALQEVEARAAREKFWSSAKPGDIMEGVVTSVRDYGAFVDLGGLEGLIHKSEISWVQDEKPTDVLKRWDPVKVRVLDLDRKRKRIALSLRHPETSPWSRVGGDFEVNGEYEGRITRIADYGAFVELAPGLTGLVRIPNISWDRIQHPSDVLSVGQQVRVRVLEVEERRRRLDLGIRQTTPDPLKLLAETYPTDSEVTGVVQQVNRMGVTLLVDGSVTAWLPAREVELPPGVMLQQRVRRGARMKAKVVELDRVRRQLKLSQTSGSVAEEREAKKRLKQARAKHGGSLGTFADLLGDIDLD